jgi:hypothetical protein
MADDESDDEHPISASRASKASAEKANSSGRNKRLITGAAIGIGSAALVAALLYANRARKDRS